MKVLTRVSVLLAIGSLCTIPVVAGDVTITIQWPADSAEVEVIRQQKPGSPVSLFVDDASHTVTLTNVDDTWDVKVFGGPTEQPRVTVKHTGSDALTVFLRAFENPHAKGSIDIWLERPGETMNLGPQRRWITFELKWRAV